MMTSNHFIKQSFIVSPMEKQPRNAQGGFNTLF